jgi:predicted acylesterase/phospholipase RssA/CRP-like cAMP-binding protein
MSAEQDRYGIRAILAGTALFGELSEEIRDKIAEALEITRVAGGTRLFAQGDAGDAAYLVLSGRLRVERPRTGRIEILREVGRGELVGELSLLTGAPRSATVRATRDTEVGRMPRDRFDALLAAYPALAIRITRMLAELLARPAALPESGSAIKTVAVRGLIADAPRRVVADGLTNALAGQGKTILVSSEAVDFALGPDASRAKPGEPLDREVSHWLDALERDHEYVVYLTDAETSPWTRRCLRQSDLILDVAAAGSSPRMLATALQEEWTSRDLVMVHSPDTQRPSGTAVWTSDWPVGRRHHVRARNLEDFARLARRISGRAVALALSGGGARGLAHIGVLRAMHELGIPVDEIGGTSMGAVIAAQYAAGMPLEEMTRLNRHGWQHYRPHRAFTLPLTGMVTHLAAERMLAHMFGDLEFEDCWLETFACSASLTRYQLVVTRTGLVAPALMASIAVPGVAPPIISPLGELLVDGGIINNLPADQFTRGAHGAVVASNVSLVAEQRPGYSTTPTSWRVARDRLFGGKDRPYYPSMFETLYHAGIVSSIQGTRRVQEAADICVQPPVERVALFDFSQIDHVMELGYRAALDKLTPWWNARVSGRPAGRRTSVLPI